jgi:hypothetical protein
MKFRGGPLEIPGGGVKIPPKKFVQRKMPGKTSCSHYVREKKFVQANSKVQIVLKKFLQRLNALKKILQRHETEKKIRACRKNIIPHSRDF